MNSSFRLETHYVPFKNGFRAISGWRRAPMCECTCKISVLAMFWNEKHFLLLPHKRLHLFFGKIYLSHSHSLTHPLKTRISTAERGREKCFSVYFLRYPNDDAKSRKCDVALPRASLAQLRSSVGKKKLCPDRDIRIIFSMWWFHFGHH